VKAEPAKPEAVLDASALIAHIDDEPGSEIVREAMANGAAISVINWIEVLSKFAERGADPEQISTKLTATDLVETVVKIEAVTPEDAIEAARLRPISRENGLSLADRACLALATRLEIPVLTADKAWTHLAGTRVAVKLIR
jgi:ribonuclease VapC